MSDDAKNRREFEILSVQDVMKTEGGRDFMWRILDSAGFFDDVFSADPYVNARNAGVRSQGVWLYNELLDASPVNVMKMIKEHTDE